MQVYAIIPARSGSKSIEDKNISSFHGKPMLAHSIEHAKGSEYINRIIVSTDSDEYRKVALSYGAEAPFLRPKEISGDLATDLQAFQHLLEWLDKNEETVPDILVHLRPTCPVRNVKDIDKIIKVLIDNPEFDSVRSVVKAEHTPYKMWRKADNGSITPLLNDIPGAHSMPRQALPEIYMQNAAIDAVRPDTILKKQSMTGDCVYGYFMEQFVDIDEWEDLENANSVSLSREKTFCFDIDGVIASLQPALDYKLAQPIRSNIKVINELYRQGHKIILHTARGFVSGIDWKEQTREQLQSWGVNYHELYFGKPAADYYIDDKMLPLSNVGALIKK